MPVRIRPGSNHPAASPLPESAPGRVKLSSPATAKPQHHGGGGGFFSRFAGDLYHAAVDSPRGVYGLGKAVVSDAGEIAHEIKQHPERASIYPLVVESLKTHHNPVPKTTRIGETLGQQTYQDVRHPLRHPGNTFLDALALASLGAGTAARVGAVGRGLRAGEGAGALGRLARAPEAGTLTLRSQTGVERAVPASRSAGSRFFQRQLNDLRNAYPHIRFGIKTQTQRVAGVLEREREIAYERSVLAARTLAHNGRFVGKFSPKGLAIRSVLEVTPLEVTQQMWRDALHEFTDAKTQRILTQRIALAERAKRYVETGPKPRIKAEFKDLAALAEDARAVSRANDFSLAQEGLADVRMLESGITAPGRIARGARHTKEAGLVGAEDFNAPGGAYVGQRLGSARLGRPGVVEGVAVNTTRRTRGSLRNPTTGFIQRSGRAGHNVPRQVAENVQADQRVVAINHAGKQFWEMGAATPGELLDQGVPVSRLQPIRDPAQFGKDLPLPLREAKAAIDNGETFDRTGMFKLAGDSLREHLFPNSEQVLSKDQMIRLHDVGPLEGYRWIDKQLLGGLNQQPLLAAWETNPAGRFVLGFNDMVNNVSKFAILYLKPAYVVPNVVGNSFLLLAQQGPFAPLNVARAVRLSKAIGRGDTILVDRIMGEGVTGALASSQGLGQRVVSATAGGYSKVVDLPFRRASFLHEARKAGFKTPAQIKDLLHEDRYAEKLREVEHRANRALIEYSHLTRFEQDVIRRVLFFYPWLKGSTRYAGEFLRDHPLQAATLGNLGQYGAEQTQGELGALPSWAQGIFKVGGSDAMPLTVNPTAAGILSQPAQLGAAAAQLAGVGPKGSGFDLQQLLTPALGSFSEMLAGQNTFGGQAPKNLGTFARNIYGGYPALTLYHRLTQDQTGRTYPLTRGEALAQFLLGGVYPKTTNRGKLNQAAAREQAGR